MSIFIKIMFSIFVYLNVKKCVLYEDNKIELLTDVQDLELHGDIPFSELNYRPFFQLKKQQRGEMSANLKEEELDRYISLRASLITTDWSQFK